MADPKETAGGAESMTLADAIKMLGEIAPQVAALTAAVGKLGGGAAPDGDPPIVEDKDPKTPPAAPGAAAPGAAAPGATPPVAAATPDSATAAAMDAALKPIRETLAGISKTVATLDAAFKGMPTAAALIGDIAARDKLADRLAAVVGTFDHAEKTLADVAAYGCEKLGLKPPKGSEYIAVDAYLTAAAKGSAVVVRTGLDAAPAAANFVTRHLSGEQAAPAAK